MTMHDPMMAGLVRGAADRAHPLRVPLAWLPLRESDRGQPRTARQKIRIERQ